MNGKEIAVPAQVETIMEALNQAGFEAYAVGGCIRDTLLGREPGDWDITTSALPWQVKKIFRRTIDTGIQHGTVTVMMGKTGYEVTTYRIDGKYEDGRHPSQVSFTLDLLEDLKRRDFTVNAMAYSHKTRIVDAFGGMEDLEKGIIRCVGNPMERFGEDALRILRAIRFSAQLDFSIEEETFASIGRIAPGIAKVSKERIQTELTKLLQSDHPERISLVYEAGISEYISPAFAGVRWRSFQVRQELSREKYVRWGAFLRSEGEETAVRVLKDLKLDNETINRVRILALWADRELKEKEEEVRRGMSGMIPQVWDAVVELNGYGDGIRKMTREIRKRGDCLDLKHLAVGGQELMEAGVRPGKEMGRILEGLLDEVLKRPEMNEREKLLELVRTGLF